MRKLIAIAIVAAAGIIVAVPVVTAKNKPEATFRVLKKGAEKNDALPPLQGRLAELVVPGSSRFVGDLGAAKAYVAAGTDGSTCFLTADDFGVGGGCIAQESLTNGATYVGSDVGDSVNLMIPVPDAYTAVEVDGKKIEAASNVVLTNVPKKNGKLKVTGDSGDLDVDLPLAPQPQGQLGFDIGETNAGLIAAMTSAGFTEAEARRADVDALTVGRLTDGDPRQRDT